MASELKISESRFLSVSYGALVIVASAVIGFTLWLSAINETAMKQLWLTAKTSTR
jgi:hypothetical protein